MTETERRQFLKTAGILLAGGVGMGVIGCTPNTAQNDTSSPASTSNDVTKKAENRAELTEQLKKLGEEEPPKEADEIGAMCYHRVTPIK